MFRSFNRCFPWLFVLVLRVSSTRTRTRRYGIEYEYEYHFIEYEYDKSPNSATSKSNGEGLNQAQLKPLGLRTPARERRPLGGNQTAGSLREIHYHAAGSLREIYYQKESAPRQLARRTPKGLPQDLRTQPSVSERMPRPQIDQGDHGWGK